VQALFYARVGEVSVGPLPDPEAQEGEVVIAVRASGICHTDIEILHGNYGSSTFPLVPGHEYAGEVIAAGPGVDELRTGDRVVVDPNIACGTCRACRRGWAHLCEALGAYGVTRNGGFAERSVVRAQAVHRIDAMPFHIAALAEPMGCVLNGLDAAYRPGAENALIFGAGPMGMLMAIALKQRGVARIMLVDVDESRLALAESFGFEPIPGGSAELSRLRHGVDHVVEATGVPTVAQKLIGYVANGGVGHFFGVCPQAARVEVSPFEIFRRQIALVGSHSLNHNLPEALRVIRAFGPQIARLVSHQTGLEDIAGFLRHGTPKGSLKIQACFA
jgi:threonine dehydrogenase-like Zn-dependent dehydrogenase